MRCQCCNRTLSDYESTLRRADTLEFTDLCRSCLRDIPIATVGREDLNELDVPTDDDYSAEVFEPEDE